MPPDDADRMAELSREYAIEVVCQPGSTDLLLALRMNYPIVPADLYAARHAAVGYRAAVVTTPADAAWLPAHGLPVLEPFAGRRRAAA